MRWRFLLATVCPLALGVWLALGVTRGDVSSAPEQPIRLTARPSIVLTRSDLRIEAHIVPDVDNAAVVLTWASIAGSSGSSRRPLDGADAPVIQVWDLRDQIPAHYVFVAALYGQRGERRGQAQAEVHTPIE